MLPPPFSCDGYLHTLSRNQPQAKQKPRLCIKPQSFGEPVEYFQHVTCFLSGRPINRKVFDQYMERTMLEDGRPGFRCTLCGKQNTNNCNVKNHIESIHFPGLFSYNCDYCERKFKSKNAQCSHVSKVHKDENFWFVILGLSGPVYVLMIVSNTNSLRNSVYQPIDDDH